MSEEQLEEINSHLNDIDKALLDISKSLREIAKRPSLDKEPIDYD
jgi:hypothetical protein